MESTKGFIISINNMDPCPGADVTSLTSDVAQFYAGKSIFITGGTGFLGKVLLEKLLYSCADIVKIYLLVRDKMGVQANQRLDKLFEKPLFSRIKQERPDVLKKVVLISGDLTSPNLGINSRDVQILIDKVSVFIHSAATVKFNEVLSMTLKVNVDGTKEALNLAQRMKNMQLFVYVSTAYSHTQEPVLKEIAYPPPVQLKEEYEFAMQHYMQHHEEVENDLTTFLRGHPNTYTFTKALAENYVIQNHRDVPVIIVRPSIVSASFNEPVAGWVDNWYGATAILSGIVKGLIRVLYSRCDVILDLIPLDYVSNLIIVATAKSKRSNRIIFYNCCSSWANPITMAELFKHITIYASKHEMSTYPTLHFTIRKWLFSSLQFLLQTCPAQIADLWLRIIGRKTRYVKICSQVRAVCKTLEFFTSNSWEMQCQNTRNLHSSLSESDQRIFPCDPKTINWNEYMVKYFDGIFKYLLKET
ncbi:hypothetical protein K1T71_008991 [Dendrolimus kikuchii]|uniref:Uncharacterized protein n=1 Tax=Dendrolimus kikuchii TaxID=765133 RepID=A0ACC1CW41_9NEOP|nr:hypothetical protein K1T71_008991 [Dendrolimus kikuchii]